MNNLNSSHLCRHYFEETFGTQQIRYGLSRSRLLVTEPGDSRHAIGVNSPGPVVMLQDILYRRDHTQELADIHGLVAKGAVEQFFTSFQVYGTVFGQAVLVGMRAVGGDALCGAATGRHRRLHASAGVPLPHGRGRRT